MKRGETREGLLQMSRDQLRNFVLACANDFDRNGRLWDNPFESSVYSVTQRLSNGYTVKFELRSARNTKRRKAKGKKP